MPEITGAFKNKIQKKISDTIDLISLDYEHIDREVKQYTGLTGRIENCFRGNILIPFQTAWSRGSYPIQYSNKFNKAVRKIEKDVISILSEEYPEIENEDIKTYSDIENMAYHYSHWNKIQQEYENLECQFGEQDLIEIMIEVNFTSENNCRINAVVGSNVCARYLPSERVNIYHHNIHFTDKQTFLNRLSNDLLTIENNLTRG